MFQFEYEQNNQRLLRFWCPSPIIPNAEIWVLRAVIMKITWIWCNVAWYMHTNISEAGCWYALTNYIVVLTFQRILVNTHISTHKASHPRRQHNHT